jgi:hypothetical protein
MTSLEECLFMESIRNFVAKTAEENGWENFYQYHLKIVPECARTILDLKLQRFNKVDEFVVMSAAWLHDIGVIICSPEKHSKEDEHHRIGAENCGWLLPLIFGVEKTKVGRIAQCILRHRNLKECPAITNEQKIIAAADGMSNLKSITYFYYHHLFPGKSIEDMAKANLQALEKDWNDISLIPEAADLCRKEYEVFRDSFEKGISEGKK